MIKFFFFFLGGILCPCYKKVKESNRLNIYVRKNLANYKFDVALILVKKGDQSTFIAFLLI